jgi:hypothetical protein
MRPSAVIVDEIHEWVRLNVPLKFEPDPFQRAWLNEWIKGV